MKEIKGDLIKLAKQARFNVIGHGCNCFCTMGKGIAPQIKLAFPEAWAADQSTKYGDIKKLGNYTKADVPVHDENDQPCVLSVLNIYSQYRYNKRGENKQHLDYDALTMALKKINKDFKGKSIALPQIGAGLGFGDWKIIKQIIEKELKDMDVTIVYYDKK